MPAAGEKSEKKKAYFAKLISLVQTWPRILIIQADHVGSRQMLDVRVSLRGKAIVLMGKNTMIRTALRLHLSEIPTVESLIPLIKLNVGFVFCIDDPADVRRIILENKVPAPARQGVIAPNDVWVPAGPTGMDPSQTSFFQALGIATKIVKGQIEIQSDVHLIKKDRKVTASESALLQKLNVKPFSYGLKVLSIFDDGSVYAADALDITDDVIIEKFKVGIQNIAAMSRQVGIPTEASISHSLVEGFKNCAALVLETDYTFREMEGLKKFIENPEAFAAVAAAPAASVGGGGGKAEVVEKKEVEEEEDEEEGDMGFSLFD